jgi:hypothetical protein
MFINNSDKKGVQNIIKKYLLNECVDHVFNIQHNTVRLPLY